MSNDTIGGLPWEGGKGQLEKATTPNFLTSLALNGAVAGVELVAFIFARRWIRAVYEPRTYIPPRENQAPPLGRGLIRPLWAVIQADPEDILRKNGVDPYLFMRFLWFMCKALVPIWFISWPVLMPIDSVGITSEGVDGLDRFTMGNIPGYAQDRLWAHVILAWLFNGWIIYLLWKECQNWLKIRQRYLVSPEHSRTAQASTVLITGIPKQYMDETNLAKLYSLLPGGVKRIWLNRDLKEMPKVWERRTTACDVLELAQTSMIKKAYKRQVENAEQIAKCEKKGTKVPESVHAAANPDLVAAAGDEGKLLSLADQLVPRKERPMKRLKPSWAPFGLGWLGIGEKVDAIEWAQKEIIECTQILDADRDKLANDIDNPGLGEEFFPPLASAFVHFNTQIAAHMAHQCLSYNMPYKMTRRYIEQSPSNVLWQNMNIKTDYELYVRRVLSWAGFIGLVVVWSFPTAFIGALSNLKALTATEAFAWLRWLNGDSFAKKLLQGVVQGILPPILLALLMLLLPAILRRLSILQGTPSRTEVELDVMTRYFIIQVINTFIVLTLTSGLTKTIEDFANNPESINPAMIANTLATNLPTASTFFLTRIMLQVAGTMGTLLQPITLLLYYLGVVLGNGTARKIFRSRYKMPTIDWGTQFPSVTVYAVIVFSYMIISPIIAGLGALFSLLLYVVFKYQWLWVLEQPPAMDTGGLFFPRAVNQVFVGLYIQQVCLCALFFISAQKGTSGTPQAALMIVLIVGTAAGHWTLNNMYNPLRTSLPLSLAHLSYGMPKLDGQTASFFSDHDMRSDAPLNPRASFRSLKNQARNQDDSPETDMKALPTSERSNLSRSRTTSNEHLPARLPRKNSSLNPKQGSVLASTTEDGEQQWNGNATWTEVTEPQRAGEIELSELRNKEQADVEEEERCSHDEAEAARNAEGDDSELQYFAKPGGPGVLRTTLDDGNDPAAFFHPATKEPQRVIWLPRDELGLGAAQMTDNRDKTILSSMKHALLDHKGRIKVVGLPPDITASQEEQS